MQEVPNLKEGFWGFGEDKIEVFTVENDSKTGQRIPTETEIEKIIITLPSKSFWDGLNLIGVPLVLAILGAWFQKTQQEQISCQT